MMKNLLFGLMTFITVNVFGTPTTYSVTYNSTTNVTCNVGDTLKFFAIPPPSGSTYNMYSVIINSTLKINPTGVTPSNGYYIGNYIVTSGDTSFTIGRTINFSGTTIPWSGTITINTTTGLFENINSPTIEIFPNPVLDVLKITTSNKTTVNILTLSGQTIMTENIQEGITDFNLTNLPSGIYFVRVGNTTRKVIKK